MEHIHHIIVKDCISGLGEIRILILQKSALATGTGCNIHRWKRAIGSVGILAISAKEDINITPDCLNVHDLYLFVVCLICRDLLTLPCMRGMHASTWQECSVISRVAQRYAASTDRIR